MDSSLSSSSISPVEVPQVLLPIPENYEFLRILGKGAYGTVIECVKKGTEEHVAVKFNTWPKYHNLLKEELIMSNVMYHGLDNFNIIKCIGKFFTNSRLSLVYEMLDISLMAYIRRSEAPVFKMEAIRTVIQQMAVAFNALKGVGIIHADVKLDNIMMVDHVRKPYRVKLIDFGLAMFTYQAIPGHSCQAPAYRAPEIILGLPFSEAIDIWSLGCVMAVMVFGVTLFPARLEYDLLRFMIDLLGPPPQHLINAGKKSQKFFKRTECGSWEFITPLKYGGTDHSIFNKCYTFTSLDVTNMHVCLETDNATEADERRECLELLKAMLQWDEKERITPSGILNHPFITKSFLNSSSHLSPCCNEPEPSTSQVDTKPNESTSMMQAGDIEVLPVGVIMVQPADPVNCIHLGDLPDEDSDLCLQPAAWSALNPDTTSIQKDTELPPAACDDCKDHQDRENSQSRMYTRSSEDSKKKKNKKSCFRRFFSWMRGQSAPASAWTA